MLYISEQARQNFPLLYNNTNAYIGEWLRQAGCRFKRNVNLTIVNCVGGGGGFGLHLKILYFFLISRHFYCFNLKYVNVHYEVNAKKVCT